MLHTPDLLTSMAIFARVVQLEGFSAAARDLGLSKSAVSKHVARLESKLGARLLNRTTRKLSLTEAGGVLYERCERIVAEAGDAELAVTRLQELPRGTLRVSAPMSFGLRHIAPAMPALLERYPELSIDLSFSDSFVDHVGEGYDVTIRIARLADSELVARRVASSRRVVVAAPRYWQLRGRPSHPADLLAGNHECLGYSLLAKPHEWHFRLPDGKPLAVRIKPRYVTNNGDALSTAAVAGAGVAWLPTFICGSDIAQGRLEPVLTEHETEPLGVFALYAAKRHLPAKVRAFVDHLVATSITID